MALATARLTLDTAPLKLALTPVTPLVKVLPVPLALLNPEPNLLMNPEVVVGTFLASLFSPLTPRTTVPTQFVSLLSLLSNDPTRLLLRLHLVVPPRPLEQRPRQLARSRTVPLTLSTDSLDEAPTALNRLTRFLTSAWVDLHVPLQVVARPLSLARVASMVVSMVLLQSMARPRELLIVRVMLCYLFPTLERARRPLLQVVRSLLRDPPQLLTLEAYVIYGSLLA